MTLLFLTQDFYTSLAKSGHCWATATATGGPVGLEHRCMRLAPCFEETHHQDLISLDHGPEGRRPAGSRQLSVTEVSSEERFLCSEVLGHFLLRKPTPESGTLSTALLARTGQHGLLRSLVFTRAVCKRQGRRRPSWASPSRLRTSYADFLRTAHAQ